MALAPLVERVPEPPAVERIATGASSGSAGGRRARGRHGTRARGRRARRARPRFVSVTGARRHVVADVPRDRPRSRHVARRLAARRSAARRRSGSTTPRARVQRCARPGRPIRSGDRSATASRRTHSPADLGCRRSPRYPHARRPRARRSHDASTASTRSFSTGDWWLDAILEQRVAPAAVDCVRLRS